MNTRTGGRCAFIVSFAICVPVIAGVAPSSFRLLGDLPGATTSQALGVSGDGSVVTGISSSANGNVGFRWTLATGLQSLGSLPGGDASSSAWAISGDGSTITGTTTTSFGQVAFSHTPAGGMQMLLPSGTLNEGLGLSRDGSVVVGYGISGTSSSRAAKWVDGIIQFIGPANGTGGVSGSVAYGISGDASVIVGNVAFNNQTSQAARWTSSGMQLLGFLPGGSTVSTAYAVSRDGQVIVGRSSSAQGGQAFRWTEAGGYEALGDVPGGSFGSFAWATNADGSIVVGQGAGVANENAFIWTAAKGTVLLRDYLISQGIEIPEGVKLHSARGISDDGRTIVGTARHADNSIEGFVVVIPAPSTGVLALMGLAFVGRRRR